MLKEKKVDEEAPEGNSSLDTLSSKWLNLMTLRRFGFKKAIFLASLVIIPLSVYSLSLLPESADKKDPILNAIVEATANPLEEIAKDSLLKEKGNYAVYIKNFKTNEEYSYNEDKVFNSASLYKLWVMAVAYDRVSKGQLGLAEILKGDTRKIDVVLEVASESSSLSPTPEISEEEKKAEDEKNSISYSLKNAIEQMIVVSDNYAAILVSSRAGSFNIQSFLKSNFTKSTYGLPPKTTAKDVGRYFELLYTGDIVSSSYSKDMLEILKRQTLNDRIPKYLPKEIDVAHKTGELGGMKHDAGIVYSSKGDYVIVILSDTDNASNAAEEIALFSKEVFNYFN